LAREGASHNILVNVIAPNAGTNMTKTILSDEVSKLFQPAHVAPIVSALASPTAPASLTGGVYEAGSGWFGKTRWELTQGPFEASGAEAASDKIASIVSSLQASSSKSYPSTLDEHRGLFQQGASSQKVRTA
jgi:multifunctional beta-oxidation protein